MARVLFEREALIFLVTLICALLIFLFFLQVAFLTIWDRVTQSLRQEIEKEADTIARLLVFEFSHLSALETQTAADIVLDQLVKRLLWEKVTFNETIRGIELVGKQTNDAGQHLTYSFFPIGNRTTEAEQAPQKTWRTFPGSEGELIRRLIQEQRLDRTILEIVNQGQRLESELLLRYFPLYISLPDRGSVLWGVVKVGISIDAMRRFLILLDAEKRRLRQNLMWAMGSVTLIALALGLLGLHWHSRRIAALFAGYTTLATALDEKVGLDALTVQSQVQDQETQNVLELKQLQHLCLHLGTSLQRLTERLITAERQAASGRLLGALIHNLSVTAADRPGLGNWANLFTRRDDSWGEVDLNRPLQEISQLLHALLPEAAIQEEREPVGPILGSENTIILALFLLIDYFLGEMPAAGELAWQVGPRPTGGLKLTLAFQGKNFTSSDVVQLLQPFQAAAPATLPLGPFLVAGIAEQHGGTLTIMPRAGGGLTMVFTLPGPLAEVSPG